MKKNEKNLNWEVTQQRIGRRDKGQVLGGIRCFMGCSAEKVASERIQNYFCKLQLFLFWHPLALVLLGTSSGDK